MKTHLVNIFLTSVAVCVLAANTQAQTAESPASAKASPSHQQEEVNKMQQDLFVLARKHSDQQEEMMERAQKLLDRDEKCIARKEQNEARFEKILDKWEAQQDQYQKYLDGLSRPQPKEAH